jgi:hypothetical protein
MRLRYREGYVPLFADGFAGSKACQAALDEIAARARQAGVPLLVVIFPNFGFESLDEAAYPYAAVHRKVLATLERLEVPALDLRPAYAKVRRTGSSWRAFPCDGDPGVEAHVVAARTIADRLRELELLTPGI